MKSFSRKQAGFTLQLALIVLVSVLSTFAATADVDTGFNPQLTIDLTGEHGGSAVIQSDGKIIIFGSYSTSVRPFFSRLNADGSLDSTFRCPECLSFVPRKVVIQPDGKILVLGGATGFNFGRVIRIHQSGSLDTSFKTTFNSINLPCEVYDLALQLDGKSILKCRNELSTGGSQELIRRINANGSLDTTFQTITFPINSSQFIGRLISLPDNKVLVGFFGGSSGWLKRYNSDGSLDNTFQSTPNGEVRSIELLPDGKYLIGGTFSSVGGTVRPKIAKLFADGTLDASFSPAIASDETFSELKALPSGHVYVHLYVTPFRQDPIPRFVRYNPDGSVDTSFNQSFLHPNNLVVDGLNRIVTFRSKDQRRYYRINADGNIDSTFNPVVSVDGFNITAALQNDGKLIVGGEFGKANGTPSGKLARINSDGTTDSTFNAGTGFDGAPIRLVVQSDGKILTSGYFNFYNGIPRTKLIRINGDGSLDLGFNPLLTGVDQIWNVYAIAPLANGKILIGGNFRTVNGTARTGFARLNADGSLDTTFGDVFSGFNTVNAILVQSDGKIMVGTNGNLVRLNSEGSFDSSYVGSSISDVGQIIQMPDGNYLVFTQNSGGNTPSTIRRLFSNGTVDFSFSGGPSTSSTPTINAVFRQQNGNVVFGGSFGDVNLRASKNIGRVGPNGESDIYFPTFGTVGSVVQILGQTDGKIIFVGNFVGIEDVGRSGIARLTLSNRTKGTNFDFDGDGRADVSVFRPSTNIWYELLSTNYAVNIVSFGESGDIAAPADYDGDGKTDLGVFRSSIGTWFHLPSSTNTLTQLQFGQLGDIPRPSDVNADGKAELVVYRPSSGIWYRNAGGFLNFGSAGDKPVIGDFDGDGRNDPAIYRPSTGVWWYAASSAFGQHRAGRWGIASDTPVPADYDGDGKTDFAIYRTETGVWYILNSSNGSATIVPFGIAEDKPVAADYDGDGKADIAVFRPSTGIWYLLQSTSGFTGLQFGISSDVPTPNSFIP
jgi:uncharacterized delta-60 repeat protein